MAAATRLASAAPAAQQYSRSVSPMTNYSASWEITDSQLFVKIEANTTGWVMLGFAEKGAAGMVGADFVSCYVDPDTQAASVVDRYAISNEAPAADASQDWSLIAASNTDGTISCELSRSLETGDIYHDRAISSINSSTRLLFAFGESTDTDFHASPNQAALTVNLVSDMSVEDEILAAPDYAYEMLLTLQDLDEDLMPNQPEFYLEFCYNADGRVDDDGDDAYDQADQADQADQKDNANAAKDDEMFDAFNGGEYSIIGMSWYYEPDERRKEREREREEEEANRDDDQEREDDKDREEEEEEKSFVHHIVAYGSYNEDCSDANAFLWAGGTNSTALKLPEGVGMSLGTGGDVPGFGSIKVGFWIRNPYYDPRCDEDEEPEEEADGDEVEGEDGEEEDGGEDEEEFECERLRDRGSGLRLFLTETGYRRPVEAGALLLGDPRTLMRADSELAAEEGYYPSMPLGWSKYSFECPSEFTSTYLPDGANIIAWSHHMHHSGESVSTKVVRDGEVVHEFASHFFDSNNPGFTAEEFTVQAGDKFETKCVYNTNEETEFGLTEQDEICFDAAIYYPKQGTTVASHECGLWAEQGAGQYGAWMMEQSGNATEDDADRTFGTQPDVDDTGTGLGSYAGWLVTLGCFVVMGTIVYLVSHAMGPSPSPVDINAEEPLIK